MVAGLAELAKASSLSFELVQIKTPSSRLELHERGARHKLDLDDRVSLSFVEAPSDSPSAVIEATNKALRFAAEAKLDVIFVGSQVLFDSEAILEFYAVGEQDPMVGFVEASVTDKDDPSSWNPLRSNNLASARQGAPIFEHMPRLSYVPIVEAPLVLIKSLMLQEFELLDCAFNSLAAAINDLALRANRCGYRIARADRVRVITGGRGRGERASDDHDAEILDARFPYLAEEIARYESSPDGKARKLLAGLRPDADGRLYIVFACNNLGTIHNGTSELAKRIITEFSLNHSSEYGIHVFCSREAFNFHQFGELTGVAYLSDLSEQVKKPFFASIRLVQPFDEEDIALLANQAPVTMVLILDTIAIDCLQIAPRLTRVWQRMLKSTSALGFISDFSRAQFDRRFPHDGAPLGFTALCSTDTKEYGAPRKGGRAA